MNYFFQRIHEKALRVDAAPVMIAALGDSVTQGVMEHHQLDSEGVYHRLVQRELEAFYPTTTFSTINAGVSGSNAVQGRERLDRDVLGHQPDLVLVAFGLNDSLGGEEGLPLFADALEGIVSRIRRETRAGVILVTPPFMARRRNFRIHPDHEVFADDIIRAQTSGVLAKYAETIRRVAVAHTVVLADVHREWERMDAEGLDTDMWLINGLNHPDRRGHKLAAQVIFGRILSLRAEIENPA